MGRRGEGRGGTGYLLRRVRPLFSAFCKASADIEARLPGANVDSLADAFENPPEEERPEGVEGEIEEEGTVEEA